MTPMVSIHDLPQPPAAGAVSDTSTNLPEGPGLVVFGASMQVDYSNRRARSLMAQSHARRGGESATDALPLKVIELGFQIQEKFGRGIHVGDRSPVRISRRIDTPEGPMRLLAFGFPDKSGLQPFRIAVVIEALGRRRTAESPAMEKDSYDDA